MSLDVALQVFVTLVSALLPMVLVVALRGLKKVRPESEMTLSMVSQASFPGDELREQSPQGLEVKYRGGVFPLLAFSKWRLANSGQKPIRRGDFEGEIELGFPADTLVDASLVRADPEQLENSARSGMKIRGDTLVFPATLFNPNDFIDITAVTKKPVLIGKDVKLQARIAGGHIEQVDEMSLTERKRSKVRERRFILAMSYAATVAALTAVALSILVRNL